MLAAQTVSTKEKLTPYIHEYLGTVGKEIVDEVRRKIFQRSITFIIHLFRHIFLFLVSFSFLLTIVYLTKSTHTQNDRAPLHTSDNIKRSETTYVQFVQRKKND